MARLTYTGAQLDAAIRKVRGDYADVSGVNLTAAEARISKQFIDASKQTVVGTMPDAVITPNVTVTGDTINDTESVYPIVITPKANVGTAGYVAAVSDGVSVTKYIKVEEKNCAPTTAQQEITPSSGKLISKITVSAIQTEEKSCTPTASSQDITPSYNKFLTKVTVVAVPTEEKTASANGVVTPSYGKFLSKVTVNVSARLQSKSVTPSEVSQEITPDNSYDGLSKVTVGAVSYPKLNAPNISLSGSTLTISNPATNGNFVTSYRVYSNGTLLVSTANTSVNLANYIATAGTFTITATACGNHFSESNKSTGVSYNSSVLTAPVISLSGDILTINPVTNSTAYKVFSDGALVTTVTPGYTVTMTDNPVNVDETGGTSTVILNEGLASEVILSPLSPHLGESFSGIKTIKTLFTNGYDKIGSLNYTMNGTGGTMYTGDTLALTGNLTIDSSINTTCLTGDTLVTMADGTQRRIDTIKVGDVILTVNPTTLEAEPDTVILSNSHLNLRYTEYDVWNLSDGTILKTVHPHRFYNVERSAMVYMSDWSIGEHFYKIDGTTPSLVSHEKITESVNHYAIKMKNHNYYANGILTGDRYTLPMILGKGGKTDNGNNT